MAAEYLANAEQNVALNSPILFTASIPCRRGNIFHEDGTGIFILRGNTNNCFARYQVVFNGNISLPEGGTVGPIAVDRTERVLLQSVGESRKRQHRSDSYSGTKHFGYQ